MSSFTPSEMNEIMLRGFQGENGYNPIIPVYADRVTHHGGFSDYVPQSDPFIIMEIGDVQSWCAGNINFTRDFWVSKVEANDPNNPNNPYNGAKSIRVTIGHDNGGNGTINIRYLDTDGNVLSPNYNGTYIPNFTGASIDWSYVGTGNLCLFYDNYHNELLFGVTCTFLRDNNDPLNPIILPYPIQWVNGTTWTQNEPWKLWLTANESDYYDNESEVPELSGGGGGGGWYRPSDTVGFSGLPSLDVLSFGFCSIYQMSTAEMQSLASFLWSNSFVDNILKNWQNPLDNIINISIVPLNNELIGATQVVKVGNVPTGVNGTKLTVSLYEKDFGRVNFKELYKNFADYSPFTRVSLFCPGAGIRQLNPDDYMDGYMHLKAYIDIFSGTCVYQLLSVRHGRTHVVDHIEANISTQIPITGRNFIDAYKAVINGVASIQSGSVTGAISSATEVKPTYEKAGSVSGSAMRLSVQTPYIFFDTPQLRQAEKFRQLRGYTSNIYVKLSDCKGYTEIKYMDMKNINLTDTEKDELKNILETGVYINDPPTP